MTKPGRCRDCKHGSGGECDQLREAGGIVFELRLVSPVYDDDGDEVDSDGLDLETRVKVPPNFGCILFEPSLPSPSTRPSEGQRCSNPDCNAQYFGAKCPFQESHG